ncbi:hypothetical protein D3C76_1409950 [compost metagenome]
MIIGIIGEHNTPTGTPASRNTRIARKRALGDAARGSSTRLRSSSSVVRLIITRARRWRAISASRSRSRNTSEPLVTMVTGWRKRSSTSSRRRVNSCSRSIGWYGSVLEPRLIGAHT